MNEMFDGWDLAPSSLTCTSRVTDSWTPEQRESFLLDWQDDEPFQQWMVDEFEDGLQTGRGQKRSIDEVNDGGGTYDEVSDNDFCGLPVHHILKSGVSRGERW